MKADAVIRGKPNENDEISLSGTFYDDYLQMSYGDRRFVRKQLGVVMLALGNGGHTLGGTYTAIASPGFSRWG